MGLIKKLIGSLGIICLFGCSNSNNEKQTQDLLKWISHHLIQISQQLETDIAKEKQGFYPHPGKNEYQKKGQIEYVLKEKSGDRLEVSEYGLLTVEDIENTNGYQQLREKVSLLQLQIHLTETVIDGDEVESYLELDEHIQDKYRYFVITVSGW